MSESGGVCKSGAGQEEQVRRSRSGGVLEESVRRSKSEE